MQRGLELTHLAEASHFWFRGFRWFVTPASNWQEFLDLCAQAWPGFESAYDSQVIGLWRCTGVNSTASWRDTYDSRSFEPVTGTTVIDDNITRRFYPLQTQLVGPGTRWPGQIGTTWNVHEWHWES